jgi:hypothetical protein
MQKLCLAWTTGEARLFRQPLRLEGRTANRIPIALPVSAGKIRAGRFFSLLNRAADGINAAVTRLLFWINYPQS